MTLIAVPEPPCLYSRIYLDDTGEREGNLGHCPLDAFLLINDVAI